MFTADSRYAGQPTYAPTLPVRQRSAAVDPAAAGPVPQSLLPDASARDGSTSSRSYLDRDRFWRLCDSNDSMFASALAARR